MELDFLKSFIVIAEMKNITLAAEALNISPSALSSGLQKLEKELGYSLFERSTKGMQLNDNGVFFLKWARKNVDFKKNLGERLHTSATERGVIRIGTVIKSDTLFIMLSAFQRRYPNVCIELFGEKSVLENYLISDIDCFMVREDDMRDLPGVMLARRNTLFILMRDTHPLATKESLTLEDLRDEPFVFSSHDGELEWTYNYCYEHGFSPNVQYLCEEFDGKLNILANSNTLAIGYNTMRLLRESMKGIKAVPLECVEGMSEKFYFVWRKDPLNPLSKLLADFALEFNRKGRAAFMP